MLSGNVTAAFEGFGFSDNPTVNNGSAFIPADPMAAAGMDRLIAVVNTMIEMRDKTGIALVPIKSLQDFFSPLGGVPVTLETTTFDPKVIYDQFEDRFLVVTLEKTDATDSLGAVDESRILLAVSKTAAPATLTTADWHFLSIDSEISLLGSPHWADYPGFEVDEEAVYITNNMFEFETTGSSTFGVRLWIVDKGVAAGFYSGGNAVVTVHDPFTASSSLVATSMPAHVFGAGGIPGGGGFIGTFLVSYSGLTNSINEFVQVIRVDDPLGNAGGPSFTPEFVNVGSIEDKTFPTLPDAPQMGCAELIEVNDRRALDAVWREDALWLVTTIFPETGPDAGQATAHWFKLNTSAVPTGAITLAEQGNIGGEDIAAATTTFMPSVAINSAGDAKFGFAASAATIFAGAYVTGRDANDTPGTVRRTETMIAGRDSYHQTFGGPRNRWGDYSGISIDPADDRIFWVFNEFADVSSAGICNGDGRWGTIYASCKIDTLDLSPPLSVDLNPPGGQETIIALTLTNPGGLPIDDFAVTLLYPTNVLTFLKTDSAGTLTDGWTTAGGVENITGQVTITGSNATPLSGAGVLINVVFQETNTSGTGLLQLTAFLNDIAAASTTDGLLNNTVPVELASFSAKVNRDKVKLIWMTASETDNFGFEIEKSPDKKEFATIGFVQGNGTTTNLQNYIFEDIGVTPATLYYRIKQIDNNGAFHNSDILTVAVHPPEDFFVSQNYPNPFNPETVIEYELPQAGHVNLSIYNLLGQKIRILADGKNPAGFHKIVWDGKDDAGESVASGVYLYRIQMGDFTDVKRLTLLH